LIDLAGQILNEMGQPIKSAIQLLVCHVFFVWPDAGRLALWSFQRLSAAFLAMAMRRSGGNRCTPLGIAKFT
jgi:hypothetical protein